MEGICDYVSDVAKSGGVGVGGGGGAEGGGGAGGRGGEGAEGGGQGRKGGSRKGGQRRAGGAVNAAVVDRKVQKRRCNAKDEVRTTLSATFQVPSPYTGLLPSRIVTAIEPLNQHFLRSSYPCELVPRSSV